MSAPTLLERLRRSITRVNADVTLKCEAALEAATEIQRLQGEAKVLRDLLNLALGVIETVEPEDAGETEMMMDLQNQIMAAVRVRP